MYQDHELACFASDNFHPVECQMKSLLLVDDRLDLLATLEPILKHWGYRVLTVTNAVEAQAFLAASTPALLLVGSNLLNSPELRLTGQEPALVALAHPDSPPDPTPPAMTLPMPVDIFRLFSIIQTRVEDHPRQNLRLQLRLPGMYCFKGQEFVLADVLSLSMQGLFFRSPLRLAAGDRVSAVFPLLGHGRELEVNGHVLYAIEPTPANNYAQGFGMAFDSLTPEQTSALESFIAEKFLGEVSACQAGVGTFSSDHLRR
jgi:CheY-like chemotaxis protein/Tfp pilus assembly protein PilZ